VVGRAAPCLTGRRVSARAALLVLRPGEWVSADHLIDELRDERPPPSARKALQMHVTRLRHALDACPETDRSRVLAGSAAGYRLDVAPDQVDAIRLRRPSGTHGRRRTCAGHARRWWPRCRHGGRTRSRTSRRMGCSRSRQRLNALRLEALEQRVEADVRLGRYKEVIADVEQLIAEHPDRETLHGQRMLALYRAGRQADALAAYRHAREILVAELRLEPGPELKDLEQAILEHRPELQLTARAATSTAAATDEAQATLRVPAPPTPTVGRELELSRLRKLVREDASRLITLVGPGGVGKTRVAIELAAAIGPEHRDGAWFVPLESLASAGDVAAAIARARSHAGTGRVHRSGARALAASAADAARARQLRTRAGIRALVADLVAVAPGSSVSVISREPLHLRRFVGFGGEGHRGSGIVTPAQVR